MSCITTKASTSLSCSAQRSVRQAPVVRHQASRVVCRAAGTDGFDSAGKDLRKAANKAGNQMADNIDSAQRKAGDAYDDAKVEAKSASRDTQGAAKSAGADVQRTIDRGIDKLNRGVDNLKDGVDHVQESASTVGDQVKQAGRFASDKVQEGVDAARKNINDAAHQ